MKALGVREIRAAEKAADVSGYTLMKRAGASIAREVREMSGGFSRIVFLAGKGNNGGDAFVGAALCGFSSVKVIAAQVPESYRGEAALALAEYGDRISLEIRETLLPGDLLPGDLVVDGILGIGFHGETVRPPFDQWIKFVNDSRLTVLSLDVPSGLNADDGIPASSGAIFAERTLTFGFPKKGFLTGSGAAHCGILHVADIGFADFPETSGTECYTMKEAARDLPRRAYDAHKFSCGSVLALCGSSRYPGAGVLCATAALRAGAGVVTLAGCERPGNLAAALLFEKLPVLSGGAIDPSGPETLRAWTRSDALIAGCGWGEQNAGLLQKVLGHPGALVLDADGLNLLSSFPSVWEKRDNVVLTPHPGEARRLAAAFGIAQDLSREELASALAETLHAVVVLKGAGTLVASPEGDLSRNTSGCARLATAGSGDVLAGVIGALLARGMTPFAAAKLGVFLHGLAGELAPDGVIADDLPALVGRAYTLVARYGCVSTRC
ncbi:MAG: NAD(P)H-hydrate dehydratase [Victivallaceae bacterium]|nr:NAD(P)H-hydrate dehydratase [Victivallaceae bacterium]